MPRHHCIAISLAGLLALAGQSCMSPADGAREIALSNGSIQVAVVPEFGGRIMSFTVSGGENLFWTNKQVKDLMWGWRNYGGEKNWIGPQEGWTDLTGKRWPPPASFDYNPYTVVSQSLTSVTLRSSVDTNWNLQVERTVQVFPDNVSVTSCLIPSGDPANVPSRRITNWSVLQLPPSTRVAARLAGKKRYANGMIDSTKLPKPRRLADDVLLFDMQDIKTSGKCSLDADTFLVEVKGGYLVIRQWGDYPDEDGIEIPERAQIYFGVIKDLPPGYEPYMEIEFAMPYPGSRQTVSYAFIPASPVSDPEQAMQKFLSSGNPLWGFMKSVAVWARDRMEVMGVPPRSLTAF